MTMKFVWIIVLFGLIKISAGTEPRGTRLAISSDGSRVTFTLYYTATAKAQVAWKFDIADITSGATNDFNPRLGTGVAILSTDIYIARHIAVAIFGSDITWTYYPDLGEENAEVDLPEINIWSSMGNDWIYDSGLPFNGSVRCSKLNDHYIEPRLSWMFIGTDTARLTPQVELASQYDPGQSHVTEPRFTSTSSYVEATAQADLTTQQGLVGITAHYLPTMEPNGPVYPSISVEKIFTIHEKDQEGVFPPGFIGVYTPFAFIGRRAVSCALDQPCSAICVGVGDNIVSLELFKTGSDVTTTATSSSSGPVFTFATFDVTPKTPTDFTNYTCKATNVDGNSAEVIIGVVRRRASPGGPPLP